MSFFGIRSIFNQRNSLECIYLRMAFFEGDDAEGDCDAEEDSDNKKARLFFITNGLNR